jgi:NADH-quinone oxidoreductase subunit I
MFGLGVLKGLGITFKHFVDTYVDDLKYMYLGGSAQNVEAFARRQGPEGGGLFTVEYPEMKLQTPENFRFLPFLITDYDIPQDSPEYDRAKALELNRCTSCGICAKVCPPQCIWIVRTDDPKTGKPIPQPAEFYIDTDICMNCGYCAEFCPFDAIKMDHDFELADYERAIGHIHDLDRLLQPISYYAAIRPTWNAKEEAARRAAEEEKERKAAEKAAGVASAPAPAPAVAAPAMAEAVAPADGGGTAQPTAPAKRSPEEIKAQREAMLAKRQAKAPGETAPEAPAPPSEAETPPAAEARPKRTPEEIKAQREAMLAKRKAKEAGEE